jgi:CubicO group peptidase (beta-lactamase class C family)
MKRILKNIILYLVCIVGTTGVVYAVIILSGEKTLHFEKIQWNPADPETQHIDQTRLKIALEYAEKRLPTARSLLLLRNGKTVVEKYYGRGGPEETDYLHSLNLPLLQVLIGIAIDHQLIRGPEQPLSDFFPKYPAQTPSNGTAPLTLGHLLKAQAPLLWGARNPDYWSLFYAGDQIDASLRVISRLQTGTQPALNFAAAYLLSQVIEKASGQDVFSFADRYLFQPLGITTYAADDDGLISNQMV